MASFIENKDVKVLYMGTPNMSAHVLESLIAANFTIVGLVCQEDKEVGRDRHLEEAPTKIVAKKYNIPVFQPHKIRLDYEFAKKLDFDVIVTMAYGQIIPQGLLDLPHIGSLNLHGSLLPAYRGAAPIQRAIMNDDKLTGVTLMEMVAAMDAGVSYDTSEVAIEPNYTYTILGAKISDAAAKLICKDLLKYANKQLKGTPQDERHVTIANKIKPEDEHLPLTKNCEMTIAYIRALSEEPGAYLFLNGKKLKVFHAKIANNNVIRAIGEIIPDKKHLLVQLYDGEIELEVVQMEGKKKMDGASFLCGAHLGEHEIVS